LIRVSSAVLAAVCLLGCPRSRPEKNGKGAAAQGARPEPKSTDRRAPRAPRVSEVWRWSKSNHEIYDPSFSTDNQRVVLTAKLHWPDGHEAEGVPLEVFRGLQARIKKAPRVADPTVLVVRSGADPGQFVGYGWEPTFAGDNTVAFARQEQPLGGLRTLAETLAGNDIVIADLVDGKTRTLARPQAGYLSGPSLSPDGKHLVYHLSDATNGSFGGAVGVGLVDLANGANATLLPPRKEHALHVLVGDPFWYEGQLLVVRRIPMAAGTYLADEYVSELLNLSSHAETVYSWGRGDLDSLPTTLSLDELLVRTAKGQWGRLDLRTKEWTPLGRSLRLPDCSIPGPDRLWLIWSCEEEAEQGKRGFWLMDWQANRDYPLLDVAGRLPAGASWSPDGTHIALVTMPDTFSERPFDQDEMIVLRLLSGEAHENRE
jgi:hypothetical protein